MRNNEKLTKEKLEQNVLKAWHNRLEKNSEEAPNDYRKTIVASLYMIAANLDRSCDDEMPPFAVDMNCLLWRLFVLYEFFEEIDYPVFK